VEWTELDETTVSRCRLSCRRCHAVAVVGLTGGPPRPFHQELASGLGILAFSMILVEFVLSGRFKSVSNGIGMDVTMRFHQVMARTALIFPTSTLRLGFEPCSATRRPIK
jgi:hypothetical protein